MGGNALMERRLTSSFLQSVFMFGVCDVTILEMFKNNNSYSTYD